MNAIAPSPFLARKALQRLAVRYIDAQEFRNRSLDCQEFGSWATHIDYPDIIPEGEIWIDKNASETDRAFYLRTAHAEQSALADGMNEDDAYDYALAFDRSERERETCGGDGARPGHDELPQDIYLEHLQALEHGGETLQVWIVDGEKVRGMFKSDFTEGGNAFVYPWMPKDEIWVEATVAPTERQFIILHEATERQLLRDEKLGYDDAHDKASQVEFAARQKKKSLGQNVVKANIHQEIERAVALTERNPTPAQKKSGNYRKGKFELYGLPISLENPRGSIRSGESADGKKWSVRMAHHYGYIRRTESDSDGDHIDVFIGMHPDSEKVFVVNQIKPDGSFDEHKFMLGFLNIKEAKAGYLACYSPGWTGLGSIVEISKPRFLAWLKTGDSGKPLEESTVITDESGGLVPTDLERARRVDLVTLPENVQGTNCGNCSFKRDGFCTHPEVEQQVNSRMCCAKWDAEGTVRAWEESKEKDTSFSYTNLDTKAMSAFAETTGGALASPPRVRKSLLLDPLGRKSRKDLRQEQERRVRMGRQSTTQEEVEAIRRRAEDWADELIGEAFTGVEMERRERRKSLRAKYRRK